MDSFNYYCYIQLFQTKLGRDLKVAQDLADLLDQPFFKPYENRHSRYAKETICDLRIQIAEDLCAILHSHGVAVPDLELETARYARPMHLFGDEDVAADRMVRAWIKSHYGGINMTTEIPKEEQARKVRAAVESEVASRPPYRQNEWLREYMARLNSELLDFGQHAVRPDYPNREVRHSGAAQAPSRPLTFLLVDDDGMALARSARPLAGYPDISIEYLHFQTDGDDVELETDDPRCNKLIEIAVTQIINWKPDIVLMDENLLPVCGAKVVTEIRRRQSGSIRFVANTGGTGDGLESVVIYDNYDKGRNIYALHRFISSI